MYGYVGNDPVNRVDPEGKYLSIATCAASLIGGFITADRYIGDKGNKNKQCYKGKLGEYSNQELLNGIDKGKDVVKHFDKDIAGFLSSAALLGTGIFGKSSLCGALGIGLGLGDGSYAKTWDNWVKSIF